MTKQTATEQLTAEQLQALREYAAENGRTWKSKLNHDWMNGLVCGELVAIRNTFGPSWLIKFRLQDGTR